MVNVRITTDDNSITKTVQVADSISKMDIVGEAFRHINIYMELVMEDIETSKKFPSWQAWLSDQVEFECIGDRTLIYFYEPEMDVTYGFEICDD